MSWNPLDVISIVVPWAAPEAQAAKNEGGGRPPPPPAMPDTPSRGDQAAVEARREELRKRARARGRAATILTSGRGVLSSAPSNRRTLLGAPDAGSGGGAALTGL